MIEEEPEPKPTKCWSCTYWALLIANILCPAFSFYSSYSYGVTKINGDPTTRLQDTLYDLGWDTVGLLQIISGIILVLGVLSIYNYFKKKDAEATINTRMLLNHGIAFGVYLLSAIIYFGTHSQLAYCGNDFLSLFLYGMIIGTIGSLIA